MRRTFFKKGERVDDMCIAGMDMWRYEAYGVWADVFIEGDTAQIPVVNSNNPGQGNFKKWLDEIEREFKRVQFNTVINPDLSAYLIRRGYKTCSNQ